MSEKIEIKSIYIRPMWVDSGVKMMGIVEIGETNKFNVQVNLNDLDTAKLILLCKDYLARALSAKNEEISNSLQAMAQMLLPQEKSPENSLQDKNNNVVIINNQDSENKNDK